jgi:hypothetical protein
MNRRSRSCFSNAALLLLGALASPASLAGASQPSPGGAAAVSVTLVRWPYT